MGKRTPLYQMHVNAHAKIVDFAGWDMPLHYGSQLEEHHQVRGHVGVFDVSHMGVIDVQGEDAAAYLRYVLANNVDKLVVGKALYTCMLNERGGVIDDLIVYQCAADAYRIIVNAGTREKDIAWLQAKAAAFNVTLLAHHDKAMLAVQGPEAAATMGEFLSSNMRDAVMQLKPFHFLTVDHCFIARTGYTGEDGYEIICEANDAEKKWQALLAIGVKPCGLGARDTLRLEAGLNLYGADMDETVTPLESNLAWTVAMQPQERDFIGRAALEKQVAQGLNQRLVGLVLAGPGILRNHQKVIVDDKVQGEVTSGGYAPTLEKSIALARVPVTIGRACAVAIRQKQVLAQVVKPPFVRFGKKVFEN